MLEHSLTNLIFFSLIKFLRGTGDACKDAPLQDTEVVEDFIVCIGKGKKITLRSSNWLIPVPSNRAIPCPSAA